MAWAMTGADLCFTHNPKTRKRREKARHLGGKNRRVRKPSDPLLLSDAAKQRPETTLEACWQELNTVRALENSTQRGNVIRGLLAIILKAQEQTDVDKRLAALEAKS